MADFNLEALTKTRRT